MLVTSRRTSIFGLARRKSALCARRIGRDKRGSAAVEFAMIAPLFLMILFAIIESALYFLASEVLESATQKTARLVLTGQAQSAGMTAANFKSNLCLTTEPLFDCSKIVVDVRLATSFGGANTGSMLNGSGDIDSAGATYNPGTSGSIVVIRVAYAWPIFVKTLGLNMADMASGNRLIQTSTAFKNE